MFKFLWKGIIRDKGRSLLPMIVVTIGVFSVVVLDGIVEGMMSNMIEMTAKFQTGHIKVMTRAYHDNEDQKPNDLALLETSTLLDELQSDYPNVDWNPRIIFGGLLDVPDANGATKGQGPVTGTAYDFLSSGSRENERIDINKVLVKGNPIKTEGEILVSNDFAEKYNVEPGDTLTFMGSTMYGALCFANYNVAGIIRFGIGMLDRGAIILDLADARSLLDMDDAASEIYGYLPNDRYNDKASQEIKNKFNAKYVDDTDEYAPMMLQLRDQNAMGEMLDYSNSMSLVMIVFLVLILAIVLWNAGILGGIRRYNEFGVRLAIGERKGHIYKTLLLESLFIGTIGSVVGTALGLSASYFLYVYGIDYSDAMKNVSIMVDPVIRAAIIPRMFYVGFIPGIIAMFIGSALAGRAIFKRNTAMLFKELD